LQQGSIGGWQTHLHKPDVIAIQHLLIEVRVCQSDHVCTLVEVLTATATATSTTSSSAASPATTTATCAKKPSGQEGRQ
jgi:hypothetical protein